MADLITPVIAGIFAIFVALTVMGFIIIRQRSGRQRFETQDYYKSYSRSDSHVRGGNPFRQGQMGQYRAEQRTITLAIISVAVIAFAISVFYDVFGGLLVIFLLPVIVRFIRDRNEENSRRHQAQDGTRSSY